MISIHLQTFPICLRATSNSTSNIQHICLKSSQHTEKVKGKLSYLREKEKKFSKQFVFYRTEGNNYLQTRDMHVSKL